MGVLQPFPRGPGSETDLEISHPLQIIKSQQEEIERLKSELKLLSEIGIKAKTRYAVKINMIARLVETIPWQDKAKGFKEAKEIRSHNSGLSDKIRGVSDLKARSKRVDRLRPKAVDKLQSQAAQLQLET